MFGGSGLRGPRCLPSFARQQWTTPRSSRSISSFRPRVSRFESPYAQNQSLAGNLAWRRSPVLGSRFNSTSSAASQAPAENASTFVPDSAPEPGVISDFSSMPDLDITSIPEKIGYLKDLGLDYGWGPAALGEYLIEHIHIWSGLPWWASIAAAGILIRIALLKPMLQASDTGVKSYNAKPHLAPINEKLLEYVRRGDTLNASKLKEEQAQIKKERGIQSWRMMVPLLQAPLGYGIFRTVYGMSALPVPGLANESVAWISDLTVCDPYYILPVVSSFLLYYSLKKGGELGTNELSGTSLWNGMIKVFPAISLFVMSSMPSALQLYFVTTGLMGVAQAMVLNNRDFRRFANLAIPDKNVGPSEIGRMIRMIDDKTAQDKAKAASDSAAQSGSQKVSSIDSAVDRVKGQMKSFTEMLQTMQREGSEKMNEISGSGPPKRADGTRAEPPRLSKSDIREAAEYEKRRAEEEEYKREERNRSRQKKSNRQ